jgi:DHA2 family multidrug resistance protein-like MFS transporter
VFLMAVPVMVLLLATAPKLLPEYRDTAAGRLDLASVALSMGAILPIVYALKETAKDGLSSAKVVVLAVGVAIGVVFVRRQRGLADPMLDLKLFRVRAFSAAVSIMLVGALTMGGVFLLVSQYLQMVAGLTAVEAGVLLVPQAGAVVVGSLIAPRLARRFRPEFVLGFGMLVAAGGIVLFTQATGAGGVAFVVVGMLIASFGMGPQGVLCTEMVVSSVPPQKAGAASAMSETSAEFGIAMGIAVFGSVATAVYRDEVAVPEQVPAEAAALATDSMAGALQAADTLPGSLADGVVATARDAFSSGLHTVAVIGAVIVVVFAVVGMIALRRIRPVEAVETPVPVLETR